MSLEKNRLCVNYWIKDLSLIQLLYKDLIILQGFNE